MDRIVGFLGRRNLIKSIGAGSIGYTASIAFPPQASSNNNTPIQG